MAPNYGGQGANAFAQGLGQGINTVQTAVSNQGKIDLQKSQAKARQEIAQRTKQQAVQRQEQMANQANTSQSDATAQNAETVEKTNALETEAKTGVKNGVNNELNTYKGATTQEESSTALANTRAAFASNPAYAKAFGIQNTDTIQELDINLDKDKNFLYNDFASRGASMETFGLDPDDENDVAEYDKMITDALPSMNYLKADGTPLDSGKLSTLTQADKSATVEQKANAKKADAQTKKVITDFQTKKLDDTVAMAANDLEAAGIKYDISNLKTNEDKADFVKQSRAKIQTKSFPTDEEATVTKANDEKSALVEAGLLDPDSDYKTSGNNVEVTKKDGTKETITTDGEGNGVSVKTTDTTGNVVEVTPNEDGATSTTTTTKADGTTETVETKNQELGVEPNTTKAVETSITARQKQGLGADETYMRHLYAQAGMTYPIPDKGAKIKQYEFLVANGLDKDTAMSWTFEPSKKGLGKERKPTSYEEASKAFLISKKGKPTLDEWTQFNSDWAKKSTGGVKDVRDDRDLAELDRNFKDVQGFKEKYLAKPNEASNTDLGLMKGIEQSNMQNSPAIKERTKESVKDMELRHRTVNAVDSLVNDLNGTIKNSTRGPIDGLVQSFKKVIGADYMTDDMADEMKQTIERDTRTGMILAEFLRMTSGLAVTEDERKFLTNVMTGGNWSDEKSLMKAISTFRDQTAEQNDVIAGTLINDAPYSSTIYRQYDTYKKADSSGNDNMSGGGGRKTTPTTKKPSGSKKNLKSILY